jgi:hypothetical protein
MTRTSAHADLLTVPASPPHVLDLLPPTAPRPEPARPIAFLKALLLFPFHPKRYGPHLALAPFKQALYAHVLALVIAAFLLGLTLLSVAVFFPADPLHDLRTDLARLILNASVETAGTSWSWLPVFIVVGCVPAAHVAIVLLGTLLMPYAAGGDRASSVWKRSVKLAYWSTTAILPVSVICSIGVFTAVSLASKLTISAILDPLLSVLIMGSLLGMTGMLSLSTRTYAGPPDGPAFSPREPRCDDCGYILIGLPLDSRCPECGTPVRESLPGGRRKPTAWQQHEFKLRGFVQLIALQWTILRNEGFFRSLPVQTGLATARHFAWISSALLILCILALVQIAYFLLANTWGVPLDMGPASATLIVVLASSQVITMPSACFYAQLRYGIQDYRVSAIACYYATPFMWPLSLVIVLAAVLNTSPVATFLYDFPLGLVGKSPMTAMHLVDAVLVPIALAALAFWWFRLLKALRSVRFANV